MCVESISLICRNGEAKYGWPASPSQRSQDSELLDRYPGTPESQGDEEDPVEEENELLEGDEDEDEDDLEEEFDEELEEEFDDFDEEDEEDFDDDEDEDKDKDL